MKSKRRFPYTALGVLSLTRAQVCLWIAIPMVCWLLLLADYLVYDGFSRNDTAAHRIYVDAVMRMMQGEGINLDHWFNLTGVGSPLFRVYQHLPHLFAGWLALKMGWNAAHSVHTLIVVFWILQFPAWYVAARWMGFSKFESLLVVYLSPLIQAWLGLGHELRSYLFYGFGLFTQAFAFPFFILYWGAMVRLLGLGQVKVLATRGQTLFMGGALGFVFLLHHYYGYIAAMFTVVAVMAALMTHRTFRWRYLEHAALYALGFVLVTAYQLVSILEDLPLQHEVLFYLDAERTSGFGFGKALSLLFTGAFFDSYRLPVLSFLALTGLILLWRSHRSRALLLVVPVGVAILFMVGRQGLGKVATFIPGLTFMNHERFVVVVQICGIFLAAQGTYFLIEWLRTRTFSPKGEKIAWVLASLPLLYLYYDRFDYLAVNRGLLAAQKQGNRHLSEPMVAKIKERGGRIWIPSSGKTPDEVKVLPRLGTMVYDSVLSELGVATFTRATDTASYGAETALYFKKDRPADYEIFNVKSAMLDKSVTPPPFYEKVMEHEEVVLYRVPARGEWDVIRIPKVEITKNELTWYLSVEGWMNSWLPASRRYLSFVPYRAGRFYPESIPKLNPQADLDAPLGEVKSQSPVDDGKSRAVLEASDENQFGLLRTAYHPRWEIIRNGKPVEPVWVGPGYLGFPLVKGENRVEARFHPDPFRGLLFSVSMAFLSMMGLAATLNLLKSISFVRRLLYSSGSVV